MSYSGYPSCNHNFKKTFWENSHDRRVTFSCTYYWKLPHLINSFIYEVCGNEYDLRYGNTQPELDPRNIKSLHKNEWIKDTKLCGDFPYDFSPSLVCRHCKQREPDPNKSYNPYVLGM